MEESSCKVFFMRKSPAGASPRPTIRIQIAAQPPTSSVGRGLGPAAGNRQIPGPPSAAPSDFPRRDTRPRVSAGIPGGMPLRPEPTLPHKPKSARNICDFRNLPSPGGKGDREAVDEERRAPPDCTVLKSTLSPGHLCPRLTPRSGSLYGLQLPHSSSVSWR